MDRGDGHVATQVSGATTYVYPWRDELANRSPVLTYNSRLQWTGGNCTSGYSPCWGTNWQTTPSLNFLANPGTPSVDDNTNPPTDGDKFRVQHLSYWTQRAVAIADINFTWWPPANVAYKYARVTVLANRTGCCASVAGNDGCWGENTWRAADGIEGATPRVICIKHPMRGSSTYGDGQAMTLRAVFHEVGHAIQVKYLSGGARTCPINGACTPNTNEEANSLNEGIAGLYALMTTLDVLAGSGNFVDADAVDGNLVQVGSAATGAVIHRGDSDVECHGDYDCDSETGTNVHYHYARALHQAYWEIAHGLNCDGPNADPCYVMPDGADANEARWALFYAMKNSPVDDSYREFVADILAYYNASVGYQAYADRWWVFNHHSLANDAGSYSPCYVP